jgi:hypothetical protein
LWTLMSLRDVCGSVYANTFWPSMAIFVAHEFTYVTRTRLKAKG